MRSGLELRSKNKGPCPNRAFIPFGERSALIPNRLEICGRLVIGLPMSPGSRPAHRPAEDHSAGPPRASLGRPAAGCQPSCQPVGMALRATKRDENARKADYQSAAECYSAPPGFGEYEVFDGAP